MIFEVRGGSFGYDPGRQNLININLSLCEPEVLSILGANGAGKTTLIKCMLGLLKWSEGA